MIKGESRSHPGAPASGSTRHNPIPRKPAKSWWKRWGEETFTAYLFLLPSFLVFAVFTFFPVIFSLVICFYRWNLPHQPAYIGLDNFKWLFTDPIDAPAFRQSVFNLRACFKSVYHRPRRSGMGFFKGKNGYWGLFCGRNRPLRPPRSKIKPNSDF